MDWFRQAFDYLIGAAITAVVTFFNNQETALLFVAFLTVLDAFMGVVIAFIDDSFDKYKLLKKGRFALGFLVTLFVADSIQYNFYPDIQELTAIVIAFGIGHQLASIDPKAERLFGFSLFSKMKELFK